ncbi:lytic polysaccharide monooxygenase [Whalleya microplaca]|nr:lytic polysaccharide monooxygenase [Whalleya microplaca]
MKSISLLAGATLYASVHPHGGVYNYITDGVDYAGHYPRRPEEGSEVTAWYLAPPCPAEPPVPFPTTPSVPEYGDDDPAVRCSGPEYTWVHSKGPIFVYMADCGGPCDQWDGSGKRWFKIWETGYQGIGYPGSYREGEEVSISASYAWLQWPMVQAGVNVTITKALKLGYYLIRHEVFNIESEVQLYPECAQLEVSGEGSQVSSEEYLVEFPGAYKEEDPGI